MRHQWCARFCLPILLFLGIIFSVAPSTSVESKNVSGRGITQVTPPQEQIVPSEQGLEKLSPDLKSLLESSPVFSENVAADQVSGDPLLVSAMVQPGADVQRFFLRSVRSRQIAEFEWVSGEIALTQLRKLASDSAVVGVISDNTYHEVDAPGLDALRNIPARISVKEMRSLLTKGGPTKLADQVESAKKAGALQTRLPAKNLSGQQALLQEADVSGPGLLDIHDVKPARKAGYDGAGVLVGVVDTGVDFSHPDLQGTQATIQNGPYAGWPYAYDTIAGLRYALDKEDTIGPDNYWEQAGLTGYVHTVPVEKPVCNASTCSAKLVLVGKSTSTISANFTWPNASRSKQYYYSVFPDISLTYIAEYLGIGYPEGSFVPPLVIVSDEHQAGVYDTVYVDINFNHALTDPTERMTRDHPSAGAVLSLSSQKAEILDLSAGILAWISDGANQPPGVGVLYPDSLSEKPPESGRLLSFIYDPEGHGTSCASLIAGQSKITDPQGQGPSNSRYAGGAGIGGVGGAVITSIAPQSKIVAFQNGFELPFDSWALAARGMDGLQNSGDEVNILSNSWGDSQVIADGFDPVSRFAQQISFTEDPNITFLVATGNGGHGYGTRVAPGGGSIIDVGASTAYGALRNFENVGQDQFLYGEVQPWSNRGPGTLGDIAPDIVATGAWGTAAVPLNNAFGDGQVAYDTFGGTSMSTPVAAGGIAMVYQAFLREHHRLPTWEEARSILLDSANDLGYDELVQGAGNIQVSRAVDMALDLKPRFSPSQWEAGTYRGKKYPAFPSILHAGEQDKETFTVENPSDNSAVVKLSNNILQTVHEETFTFAFSAPAPGSVYPQPIFLKDLTSWIDTYQPDMVRAQVAEPYTNFDVGGDYYADSSWSVYFYDWLDRNGNGILWNDRNHDGRVDDGEMDIDPATGLYEYNRFTYGYPQADYLEASLGSKGLAERHNGVFLGLRCDYCSESTTLQVRVTFYKKVNWNWLDVRWDTPELIPPSSPSLEIPGKNRASFTGTLSVPDGTPPGVYQGAIELDINGEKSTLPVIVNVAANSPTFQFGGPANLGLPYDNAHLFGGFNWRWRYESGDWRFFYYDIPDGTAGPGKSIVADTLWGGSKTDIDTWILGPAADEYSQSHPDFFGPQGMQISTSSADSYVYNGLFHFKTNTGYSHELVSAPVQDGLSLVALHNVLNSGMQLAEQFFGKVFEVASDPGLVAFKADAAGNTPPYLSGTQKITINSTGDIEEGIQIQPFGMSAPVDLPDQVAVQDSPTNFCSASWVYKKSEGGLEIHHGGLLEITTASESEDLDVDLYLFQDDGDGKWDCSKELLKAYSLNANSDEKIRINFPEDGTYWIAVHGNRVPIPGEKFNVHIRSISGSDLTMRDIPLGTIHANQPITFTVDYHGKYEFSTPTTLEGVLFIGIPSVPDLLEVPVQAQPSILLYPTPEFSSSALWVASDPVSLNLSVQNQGIETETVQAQIQIPVGLTYVPGSVSAPGNPPVYDVTTRTLNWQGPITGGEKGILTFRVTGQPDFPTTKVQLVAQVTGVLSGQTWSVKTLVWANAFGTIFPLIRR